MTAHLEVLQPLMDSNDVENIDVYGHDQVVIEYSDGRVERLAYSLWPTDDDLRELIDALTEPTANRATGPQAIQLLGAAGEEISAATQCAPFPVMNIRLNRHRGASLDKLAAELNIMTPLLGQLLAAAARSGKAIVVAGPQNSGKSLMLQALDSAAANSERAGLRFELHAKTPAAAFSRILAPVFTKKPPATWDASLARAVADIDLVVQMAVRVERATNGRLHRRRYVDQVVHPAGTRRGEVQLTDVFRSGAHGVQAAHRQLPDILSDLFDFGLDKRAWDEATRGGEL